MQNLYHMPQLASWVGFDDVFNELDRLRDSAFKAVKYPPYNVKKVDDNHFVIELAVAGFARTDLDITMVDNQLVIKGEMKDDADTDYVFKGIAGREFERSFTLADTVTVKNASLVNGMLKVWLEQFVPEAKKPKKIEVNDAESPELNTIKAAKKLTRKE